MAEHEAAPLEVDEPVLLIKIPKLWRRGMSPEELYEATRACWKISKRNAEQRRFVLAVAEGLVREVYRVDRWQACHKLTGRDVGRFEFVGSPAQDRAQWIGKDVSRYFPRGSQNSIRYIAPDPKTVA